MLPFRDDGYDLSWEGDGHYLPRLKRCIHVFIFFVLSGFSRELKYIALLACL